MKVVLLINRNFDYFWFSNIISHLNKKKFEVECWHIKKSIYENDSKSYLDANNIKFGEKYKFKIKKINDDKDFVKSILKSKFNKILSLDPLDNSKLFNNLKFLKKLKRKMIILIRSYDFFIKNNQLYFSFNKYRPILCGISNYKILLGLKYLKKMKKFKFLDELNKNKIKNIGYFSDKTFKNNKKKKYIIYLPYYAALDTPFDRKTKDYTYSIAFYEWFKNNNTRFSLKKYLKKIFYVFKIFTSLKAINIFLFYNEKEIIKNIYKFAKENNLQLIIKTRKKTLELNYHYKYSDKVIIDDHSHQNPNYLQKLIPESRLVIGYSSETIMETILNDVPFININNLSFTLSKPDQNIFFYKTGKNSEYNFQKLIYMFTIYGFIKKFKSHSLNDFVFSKESKRKYLNKYLNYDNLKTLNKIVKIIRN